MERNTQIRVSGGRSFLPVPYPSLLSSEQNIPTVGLSSFHPHESGSGRSRAAIGENSGHTGLGLTCETGQSLQQTARENYDSEPVQVAVVGVNRGGVAAGCTTIIAALAGCRFWRITPRISLPQHRADYMEPLTGRACPVEEYQPN